MKSLSQMSLEELWKLFPIYLTEPQEAWTQWYEEEKNQIDQILAYKDVQIHHIGSTAIHGIWAKPIIDILIELPFPALLQNAKEQLCSHGYLCMSQQKNRISLNKGYSQKGLAQKVFHVHLRLSGDHDEIYFRDYLNAFPPIAKEYETLKLSLWTKYEFDRDEYTNQKAEFVTKYTQLAKARHHKE
ncbi:MAG: GrpB family protein [Allobaculum sp.]|nr:GrpB family protein [Allobaculum sp.]